MDEDTKKLLLLCQSLIESCDRNFYSCSFLGNQCATAKAKDTVQKFAIQLISDAEGCRK